MSHSNTGSAQHSRSHGRVSALDLHKSYHLGEESVAVLRGANLELAAGEAVAIVGPSGTGKSTLLHLIGTLEQPDRGTVQIDGVDTAALSDGELSRFRCKQVGFVFQDHHLLPQHGVLQNVLMPTLAHRDVAGLGNEERARELLESVGLSHRLEHRPAQLSGGERQRAAIARALINRPAVLLCDEPTGNLDSATAATVSDVLFELHAAHQNTMVVVTHSLELAARFARTVVLEDGVLREGREPR